MSPTERSLKLLREQGYLAQVVEKWNPHAKVRQDLFGLVDVLALQGPQTLAVQTTSASNVAARVKKIANSECIKYLREAGWSVVVHGWTKGKREPRIVDLS